MKSSRLQPGQTVLALVIAFMWRRYDADFGHDAAIVGFADVDQRPGVASFDCS